MESFSYKDFAPDGAGLSASNRAQRANDYPEGITSFSPALPRRRSGYAGWWI